MSAANCTCVPDSRFTPVNEHSAKGSAGLGGQLALGVTLRDAATLDNFFVAGESQLLATLRDMAVLSGEQFIYLWGPRGSGKSHLAQALCHAAGSAGNSAALLPLARLRGMRPAMLEGLESQPIICVDDVDAVAGDAAWEQALFHLYNRLREHGGHLLVTASSGPRDSTLELADLRSRLAHGLVCQLPALDDSAKAMALQQRARVRGIELPDEVIAYLLKRCPRDMNSLFEMLERLDWRSLAAKRRVTLPFVRELLKAGEI